MNDTTPKLCICCRFHTHATNTGHMCGKFRNVVNGGPENLCVIERDENVDGRCGYEALHFEQRTLDPNFGCEVGPCDAR